MELYLDQGNYVVLPRTNGCTLKRPFREEENLHTSLTTEDGQLSEVFEGAIESIFLRADTSSNGTLSFEEFKEIYS